MTKSVALPLVSSSAEIVTFTIFKRDRSTYSRN